MDYSKVCYQIHHLALNRTNTVSANRTILDQNIDDLNLKTVYINNKNSLDEALSEVDFNLNVNETMGKLKYQEIGLWYSNFKALKNFISTDYDYIILIEDDVQIDNNFYSLLNNYFPQIPSDMDCFVVFNPKNIFYNSGYENLNNPAQYYTEFNDIWIAHQTWSTGALMFNKSGAQKVLNYINNGIGLKYDEFIFGQGFSQYDPLSNKRALNVYSLSKDAQPLSELKLYNTIIQTGDIIESI